MHKVVNFLLRHPKSCPAWKSLLHLLRPPISEGKQSCPDFQFSWSVVINFNKFWYRFIEFHHVHVCEATSSIDCGRSYLRNISCICSNAKQWQPRMQFRQRFHQPFITTTWSAMGPPVGPWTGISLCGLRLYRSSLRPYYSIRTLLEMNHTTQRGSLQFWRVNEEAIAELIPMVLRGTSFIMPLLDDFPSLFYVDSFTSVYLWEH